jgi:hypothetical protein
MKTIKVSEATNIQLDWLVQEALLRTLVQPELGLLIHRIGYGKTIAAYTTDWSQMGPIIDRMMEQGFALSQGGPGSGNTRCWAILEKYPSLFSGPTPMIAAARCYVASKMGETAEVPEEL